MRARETPPSRCAGDGSSLRTCPCAKKKIRNCFGSFLNIPRRVEWPPFWLSFCTCQTATQDGQVCEGSPWKLAPLSRARHTGARVQNMLRVRAARAHHAAFASFWFCWSGTSDAEIRVMAAEEGLVEDSFEVSALLPLIRRAPGPEGRPPGEASSSKALASRSEETSHSPHLNFCFLQHQQQSQSK